MRDILDRITSLDARLQALVGVGLVLVVVAAIWALGAAPEDLTTSPEVQPTAGAATIPPAAAPQVQPGEIVADGSAVPQGVAPISASGAGGSELPTPAPAEPAEPKSDLAKVWEEKLAQGVPPLPPRPGSVEEEEQAAPADVKAAGAKLLAWQDKFVNCYIETAIDAGLDWRNCLERHDPGDNGVIVEEMWDMGKGFRAYVKTDSDKIVILIRQSNEAECRTLADSESCTAW